MRFLIAASAILALSGCSLYQTAAPSPASTAVGTATPAPSPLVLAIENPNNIAKAAQGAVQFGATAFLARNPGYAAEITAAADAMTALAAGNVDTVTPADVTASLAKTKISAATQSEVASYVTSARALFESSFAVNFPTMKPNYAIFFLAVANGLNGATGKLPVPLPVIPWPPSAVTPAPTPIPAATS
jgi:hypothetical protein